MARWDPGAEERLRRAALELYRERGFEQVTVSEITERAGLTRRTFFRYFADKREVLFAGSERLPAVVVDEVAGLDPALPPLEVVLRALGGLGEKLVAYSDGAPAERRRVIAASPELQERERTKLAGVTDALAGALAGRGVPAGSAALLADVGVAILRAAFERWGEGGGAADFLTCFRAAAAEVGSGFAATR